LAAKESKNETLSSLNFQDELFWVMTPCSIVTGYQSFRGLSSQGGSTYLWNVGILPQNYTPS